MSTVPAPTARLTDGRVLPRLHVLTAPTQRVDDLRVVDAALAAGAPAIQVRCKGLDDREYLAVARAVTERAHAAGAWCIVNDRVDVALASGADGVHLGADDLPVADARSLADAHHGGESRLVIGGTARDAETGQALIAAGADYLGVGPTFATRTKDGLPDALGPGRVAAIAADVDAPVIAIAGIDAERIAAFADTAIAGVAVVGAVTAAPDPGEATRTLLDALDDARIGRVDPEGRT